MDKLPLTTNDEKHEALDLVSDSFNGAIKKKVFFVLDESATNVLKNRRVNPELPEGEQSVEIVENDESVTISTINPVTFEAMEEIKSRINQVNGILDGDNAKAELKELYTEIINNGEFTEGGGGGLGFAQMARKTLNKLDYKFDPIDEENFLFTFTCVIDKVKKEVLQVIK